MNSIRKQIQSMLTTEPREGGFRATFTVSDSLSILPDHFPGHPILPGMCMAQAVVIAAADAAGDREWHMRSLKTAKWMAPIQPGDVVTIDAAVSPIENTFAIRAKLTKSDQKVAEFSLIAYKNN